MARADGALSTMIAPNQGRHQSELICRTSDEDQCLCGWSHNTTDTQFLPCIRNDPLIITMAPKTTRSTVANEEGVTRANKKKRLPTSAVASVEGTPTSQKKTSNATIATTVSPNDNDGLLQRNEDTVGGEPATNEGTKGISESELERLRCPRKVTASASKDSPTYKMDKLFVVATKTNEMVAIIKNRTCEGPGFVRPVLSILGMPEYKEFMAITDIYNQVDDSNPTTFKTYTVQLRNEPRTIEVPQPIIVYVPKELANNTRANRKKWGERLAEGTTKLIRHKYERTFGITFHQDTTPVILASRPPLSDFLTIPDVFQVIRNTYPGVPEEQLKNTDSLMEKYYGRKLESARRYFHMDGTQQDPSHPSADDFLQFTKDQDSMGYL